MKTPEALSENRLKDLGPAAPPRLHFCSWIKKEDFYFLDRDEAYLVLYTFSDKTSDEDSLPTKIPNRKWEGPKFKQPEKWVNLMHQTAGYACHHYYLHARFLSPKPKIVSLLKELPEKYNDSCISRNCTLNTALEYQKLLENYGLSANRSYQYLEEGFYPIDIECLPKVTKEEFPEDLNQLLLPPEGKKSNLIFYRRNFGIAILGPNCD